MNTHWKDWCWSWNSSIFVIWCQQLTHWRSPLNSTETKPVNLKGNQPWILSGRTDAEAEAPVFWSPVANSQLIGKVPDTGRDWGRRRIKKVSEGEMAGWHHWCNGHEPGQTSEMVRDRGGLEFFSPWGHKELDTTGRLNNKDFSTLSLLTIWAGYSLLWGLPCVL